MGNKKGNELGIYFYSIKNIKLWEKDLEDFLKPMNHSIIKGKMIAES